MPSRTDPVATCLVAAVNYGAVLGARGGTYAFGPEGGYMLDMTVGVLDQREQVVVGFVRPGARQDEIALVGQHAGECRAAAQLLLELIDTARRLRAARA